MEPENTPEQQEEQISEELRIRASAIIDMGRAGDREAIAPLTEILQNPDEIPWIRGCAAIALGRISGEEVLPPLITALGEDSLIIIRAVIVALAETGDRQAIVPLQDILTNQNKKELHALTVTALSRIGGLQVTGTLVEELSNQDERVRRAAAFALSGLRVKEAVLPFIKLLKDNDECLRAIAASALGLIGDDSALEPLAEALNDEADTVRAIAASSLGYLGQNKAVASLEKALDDKSNTVRRQAGTALSRLKKEKTNRDK